MKFLFGLPGMQAYAVCAVILMAKMFAIAFGTAITRAKAKTTLNPEDTKVTPEGTEVGTAEADSVLRFKRAHQNDLENIPIFLVIGLLFVLNGATASSAWIYCGIFTLARVSHTLCYLNGVQPWRTASYGLGVLVTLGLMVRVLIMVF